MIGGGPGAFIGDLHRKASRMDGLIELVAGAFGINPRKSKQMGRELCIDPKRTYNNYQEPLSVEWEDSGMDREHGAEEACTFVKSVDFPPSEIAFDAAFEE